MDLIPTPALVAHRGDPSRFPENTIASLRAAVDSGARFVEFDVQLSADKVPVLMHDSGLVRITRQAGCVMDLSWEKLSEMPTYGIDESGNWMKGETISSLDAAIELLVEHQQVHAFVELKRDSLIRFGRKPVLDRVLSRLKAIEERCTLISFDPVVIGQARERGFPSIGWVLNAYNHEHREEAEKREPDYLFCSKNKFYFTWHSIWPGPWRWIVYSIDDADSAIRWAERGFDFVETNRIGELLADERFQSTGAK